MAAEVTMICVDNSVWMKRHPNCIAQSKAVKLYCETQIKCNPNNRVGLFRMAEYQFGQMLSPTSDLEHILFLVRGLHVYCGGEVDISFALVDASLCLLDAPPHLKRRLLVFVGSPVELDMMHVEPIAKVLKRRDVSLDVVYFTEDTSGLNFEKGYNGYYYYPREELGNLVSSANDDVGCHIVDVDESSVCEILSMSILKEDFLPPTKKDEEEEKENLKPEKLQPSRSNEKNIKAAAAAAQYGQRPKSISKKKIFFFMKKKKIMLMLTLNKRSCNYLAVRRIKRPQYMVNIPLDPSVIDLKPGRMQR